MSTDTRAPAPITTRSHRSGKARPLAGTGHLLRLALRRDRVTLPVWIVALVALPAVTAPTVLDLYGTQADRLTYARTWASSVVTQVFNGPAAGPVAGAIVVAESFLVLALLPALMSIFTVVRHTRQNEEAGRADLLGSAVVGRHAPLTAAVLLMLGADLLIGAGVTAVLIGAGLPTAGSIMAGVMVAGMGASFGALAAVTAQIWSSSRGANGAASAALATSFLLRAVGDTLGPTSTDGLTSGSAWPSWLSPLGWASQVSPYVKDDPWPLILIALWITGGVLLANVLVTHRDVGAGLVADRRGRTDASRWLLSPLGLAWRLHRAGTAGWLVASAALGAAMGAITDEVDDLFEGNAEAAEMITAMGGADQLADAYLGVVMSFFALMAGGFMVQGVLRLHAEEAGGRLEPILAGVVSRSGWAASHLVCVVGGAAALLAVGGLSAGVTYGLATGDVAGEVARLIGSALVQLPAASVLGALVLLAFGCLPGTAAPTGWGLLILFLLVFQLGELLKLPQAVMNLSPFTHTPAVPATELEAAPLLTLTAVAVAIAAAALAALRRRNIPT